MHLAGTFAPTETMYVDAVRAGELVATLVRRAQASGRLRQEVEPADATLALEACAAIRLPDPTRTRQLRRRTLALLLPGLAATEPPLPGPPPDVAELNWRRQAAG